MLDGEVVDVMEEDFCKAVVELDDGLSAEEGVADDEPGMLGDDAIVELEATTGEGDGEVDEDEEDEEETAAKVERLVVADGEA